MVKKQIKQKISNLFGKESANSLSAMSIMPKDVRFESQNKGEDVCMLLRQHWVTNIPWMLNLVIGLVLPFVAFFLYGRYLGGELFDASHIIAAWVAWYLALCTYALLRFLRWFFNAYIITDQRVLDLDYYGLLHHRISEASLRNVEDVASGHVGLWQNLFDFGHIRVQTAAERHEIGFENVPRPGYIQDKIMDLADLVKNGDL